MDYTHPYLRNTFLLHMPDFRVHGHKYTIIFSTSQLVSSGSVESHWGREFCLVSLESGELSLVISKSEEMRIREPEEIEELHVMSQVT